MGNELVSCEWQQGLRSLTPCDVQNLNVPLAEWDDGIIRPGFFSRRMPYSSLSLITFGLEPSFGVERRKNRKESRYSWKIDPFQTVYYISKKYINVHPLFRPLKSDPSLPVP